MTFHLGRSLTASKMTVALGSNVVIDFFRQKSLLANSSSSLDRKITVLQLLTGNGWLLVIGGSWPPPPGCHYFSVICAGEKCPISCFGGKNVFVL